jgi:predicted unusual protein kinase regulating ubiquinone biosynthesis (AarF/ABC1/UbiB family)
MFNIACLKNDGLYVKFGQGMATLDHLLPPPFYKYLSKLQDKAKSVEY